MKDGAVESVHPLYIEGLADVARDRLPWVALSIAVATGAIAAVPLIVVSFEDSTPSKALLIVLILLGLFLVILPLILRQRVVVTADMVQPMYRPLRLGLTGGTFAIRFDDVRKVELMPQKSTLSREVYIVLTLKSGRKVGLDRFQLGREAFAVLRTALERKVSSEGPLPLPVETKNSTVVGIRTLKWTRLVSIAAWIAFSVAALYLLNGQDWLIVAAVIALAAGLLVAYNMGLKQYAMKEDI